MTYLPRRTRGSVVRAAAYQDGGTSEKKIVRDWITAYANSRIQPSRILALPAREGSCVELFRKAWPKAEIVGIERSRGIVRTSTLEKRFRMVFYNVHLDGLMRDIPPLRRTEIHRKHTKNIGKLSRTFGGYGVFDFAYLDFCGKPDRFADETNRFIQKKLQAGGVCAVTFTITKTSFEENPTALLSLFPILSNIELKTYDSPNGAKMVCLVGQKVNA